MIENFNPNDVALNSNNVFGLPSTPDNSKLIIIPIPWEVTVSYRNGTARAPEVILEASKQIDLCDLEAHNYWKYGYHMLPIDKNWVKRNDYLRHCAELVISDLTEAGITSDNSNLNSTVNSIQNFTMKNSTSIVNNDSLLESKSKSKSNSENKKITILQNLLNIQINPPILTNTLIRFLNLTFFIRIFLDFQKYLYLKF